jgi:hypothetical protein
MVVKNPPLPLDGNKSVHSGIEFQVSLDLREGKYLD